MQHLIANRDNTVVDHVPKDSFSSYCINKHDKIYYATFLCVMRNLDINMEKHMSKNFIKQYIMSSFYTQYSQD